MMVSRRRVLAATAGGLAALAGCQSDGDTADGSTTHPATSATPTTTRATTGSSSPVDVGDIVVRKAVRYESMMGSSGVLAASSQQYVVATVQAGEAVSPSDFAFAADDRTWSPGLPDTRGALNRSVAGHGGGAVGSPATASEQSYLAFAVPSPLSAPNPRIEYAPSGDAWPLPAAARDRLAAPEPRFDLVSLDAPDAVTRDATLAVSLTVENTTETDGRFLAAVYWPTTIADDDESTILERSIAAGASIDLSVDVDTAYADTENETTTLTVDGHVSAEREVTVRSPDHS